MLYVLAIIFGAGSVGIEYYLHQKHLWSQAILGDLWLGLFYPIYLVAAVVVMRHSIVSPWKWAFLVMIVYYISMFNVFGTQIPPLEIVLVILFTLPIVAAGYLGKFLRKKH